MFVRVVQRQGWDLELVERQEKLTFVSREAALNHARSLEPEWIELGEVVAATSQVPQHHIWVTLRRQPDGSYQRSGLAWGGRPPIQPRPGV
jgi:hypothetical protein